MTRPYPAQTRTALAVIMVSLWLCLGTSVLAAKKRTTRPKTGAIERLSEVDASTKAGLNHLYNLEYDQAIADFTKATQSHPDDLNALNHLLQAVLLKELYRLNALDTTLYADNGFLTGKPLPGDPQVKQQIDELSDKALKMAEERLKKNPDDVNALYNRGVTKGLRLSYVAIIEKSFWAALRNATASRHDHERVLELDPNYTDAKLVVGVHNFVIGKKKGLELLQEVGKTDCDTSVDARVALSLFLRREGKYAEALEVERTLTAQFPRNFLFALEEANLLKDAGKGPEAATAYSKIVEGARAGTFTDPHLERAVYGLAEVEKGQRHPDVALARYQETLGFHNLLPDIRVRALLGAGQMADALGHRDEALRNYQSVIALDGDSPQASAARRYINNPYAYSND